LELQRPNHQFSIFNFHIRSHQLHFDLGMMSMPTRFLLLPRPKALPIPFSAFITLLNMTSSIPTGEGLAIPARIQRFWELLPPLSGE
jgi:hypothetical protein